jgi:predicted Zn-ribbon and HTH transcriptional regulator
MPNYAVCTRCDFLRVLGQRAYGLELPSRCPKCDAELVVREESSRFDPAHVHRVARQLHQARI